MTTFAMIAGGIGAAVFAMLVGLVAVAPHRNRVGRYLIAAASITAAWFAVLTLYYYNDGTALALSLGWAHGLEIARDAAWLLFLARLLDYVGDAQYRQRLWLITSGLLLLLLGIAGVELFPYQVGRMLDANQVQLRKAVYLGLLLTALSGLVMTEQLFRNTARGSRWALKHLCFGLGLIFAYDFYLYANAALFNRVDQLVWTSRGLVNALAVPMIALSASRNRDWDLNIFVSRRVVFHAVTLIGAGAYLIAMAAAGYYIQVFGGEWGRAFRAAFFSAAVLVLLSLFFSDQVRSRVRVFLARHFYRNKYEYGDEWLKFTQALSGTTLDPETLNRTILESIADIVDSPGGLMLQQASVGRFAVTSSLGMYENRIDDIAADAPFISELATAAVPLLVADEAFEESGVARLVPDALMQLPEVGLIVPIVHRDQLLAILVLARPRSNQQLDFEDVGLLNTVSRQSAGYLALKLATDALAEARQFETFNRLSAFLVHDLKNVVAQLNLIVRNAERHGDNPEFVADAFNTVGDAVAKMNRMLASLRQNESAATHDTRVELGEIARVAAASKEGQSPQPVVNGSRDQLYVRAGRDRLLSVVEHLLQNAIEATDSDGRVEITLEGDEVEARIVVADTGCGMDRDFINNRLFKAFDTTKGKAGMGIGAYESRHLISSLGGELRVESEPGKGSRFTIVLPRIGATAGG